MELKLNSTHNNISLGLKSVKNKKKKIIKSQIMVYVARHRVHIFISYTPSTSGPSGCAV